MIRGAQEKIYELDQRIYGSVNEDVEMTEKKASYDDSDVIFDKDGEPIRHCCILRGEKVKSEFHRGFATQEEHMKMQNGCRMFKGQSSTHTKKLLQWIIDNKELVDEENKDMCDEKGEHGHQWCTIVNVVTRVYHIVPTADEAEQSCVNKPNMKREKHKTHKMAKAAMEKCMQSIGHSSVLEIIENDQKRELPQSQLHQMTIQIWLMASSQPLFVHAQRL